MNAEKVNELNTITGVARLWNEWLKGWFDGAAHDIGGNVGVPFPKAEIHTTDQGPATQPMGAPEALPAAGTHAEIRLVRLSRPSGLLDLGGDDFLGQNGELLQFWVYARCAGQGESVALRDKVGELLYAVLNNPTSRYPLAQKGITHLAPTRPQPIATAAMAVSLVSCSCTVQFMVKA